MVYIKLKGASKETEVDAEVWAVGDESAEFLSSTEKLSEASLMLYIPPYMRDNVTLITDYKSETLLFISKLEESNAEIAAFDPEKKDPELQTAIIENKNVLAKRKTIVQALTQRLGELQMGMACSKCDAVPPESTSAGLGC